MKKYSEKLEATGYTFDDNADNVFMKMGYSNLFSQEWEARDEYNNSFEKPVYKVTIIIERITE